MASPNENPTSMPSPDSAGLSSLSWQRFFLALWGMGVATYIALGPMLHHFSLAASEKSWWHLGVAGILLLPVLVAFWPTSLRDVAGLATAIKGLLPGGK